MKLIYPINRLPSGVNMFNQLFGEKAPVYTSLGLKGHNGIDFFASDGTPVYATHDGTISYAGYDNNEGLGIVLINKDQDYKTIYWHLKPDTLLVKVGDTVSTGQQLAQADNTGLSTGSHLHFGLKPIAKGEQPWSWYNTEHSNGYKGAIDPIPHFNGFYPEDVQNLTKKLLDLLKQILALLAKKAS